MGTKWYQSAYRRAVVDMHITDHDERFLSEFDAGRYAERVAQAEAQSAVVYAHSHVGLCFFPTKVGPAHGGMRGRDFLRETIGALHARGIAVVVYYSLIFDTMAFRAQPDWRIIDFNGNAQGEHGRYGVCCPNSPYRDYVSAIVAELCEGYSFEGLRFDMTFWPGICYCRHCRGRFAEEAGGDLARVVNWEDPFWVAFQRRREEWLVDFAAQQTAVVRRLKPDASVEHQSSVYHAGWRFGVTHKLAPQNDFLQGDFYGDALQGSFARKLFLNLTPNRPGAFETCISVDLGNYTTLKSPELLKAKACAALADACAFVFIDSIDPLGTLNPAVYERMGAVFAETKRYEPYLGGDPAQDVAVYLSTESKCDFADNGKAVDDPALSPRTPHVDAAVSACKTLIDHHIPFGVVTRASLGELSRHRIVVLPNVLMLSPEEAEAFREYVRAGGCLYASAGTSLVTTEGIRQPDFLLGDVFGAGYRGQTKERFTYIAPAPGAERLFGQYTREHPPGFYAPQVLIEALPGAEVLGTVVLPFTDPADPDHFASIHNNPPGRWTDHPAILLNRFGAGKAVYATVDLEATDPHREVFAGLLRLLSDTFSFSADAPKCVEVTLFRQPGRDIISLVNFQKELPNVPVRDARVRVRLEGRTPARLLLVPDEVEVPFTVADGCVQFEVPALETLHMFALEHR